MSRDVYDRLTEIENRIDALEERKRLHRRHTFVSRRESGSDITELFRELLASFRRIEASFCEPPKHATPPPRPEQFQQDVEQLRIQLAGCLSAAEGCLAGHTPVRGDWSWSPAFQAVVDLRRNYDSLCIRWEAEAESANAEKPQPANEPEEERQQLLDSLKSAAEVVIGCIDRATGKSSAPFYQKERAAAFILDLIRWIEELQSANAGKSQLLKEPEEERQQQQIERLVDLNKCESDDPCAYDHTCRIHKIRALLKERRS